MTDVPKFGIQSSRDTLSPRVATVNLLQVLSKTNSQTPRGSMKAQLKSAFSKPPCESQIEDTAVDSHQTYQNDIVNNPVTTTYETLEPPGEELSTTLDRHHFTMNR